MDYLQPLDPCFLAFITGNADDNSLTNFSDLTKSSGCFGVQSFATREVKASKIPSI
jgi:hypothetical protein